MLKDPTPVLYMLIFEKNLSLNIILCYVIIFLMSSCENCQIRFLIVIERYLDFKRRHSERS